MKITINLNNSCIFLVFFLKLFFYKNLSIITHFADRYYDFTQLTRAQTRTGAHCHPFSPLLIHYLLLMQTTYINLIFQSY